MKMFSNKLSCQKWAHEIFMMTPQPAWENQASNWVVPLASRFPRAVLGSTRVPSNSLRFPRIHSRILVSTRVFSGPLAFPCILRVLSLLSSHFPRDRSRFLVSTCVPSNSLGFTCVPSRSLAFPSRFARVNPEDPSKAWVLLESTSHAQTTWCPNFYLTRVCKT
jgi:hypothetical protein